MKRLQNVALALCLWMATGCELGVGTETLGTGGSPGTSQLALSNLQASDITNDSALISWGTTVTATSVVQYGLTATYSSSTPLYGLTLNHQVELTGLSPGTTYHYAVTSEDTTGGIVTSADATFTTLGGSATDAGAHDAGTADAGSSAPLRLVQHTACTGAGTSSVTCTLPSASHSGDLLVVVGGWSPTTDLTNAPTDSFGNAFHLVGQAGSDQLVVVYYAQNIAGGSSHAVTWTVSGATATPLSLELAEFSGASTTAAYAGNLESATGSSATPNAGAVTPSVGSLVLSAMAHDSNVTTTPGAGFALLDIATDDASALNPVANEFLIASSTASVSGTFSLSASAPWSAVVAIFQPSNSDGGSGSTDAGTAHDAGTPQDAGTGNHGSGTCAPTASGPGGAGSANVPGSNVPAFPQLSSAYRVTGLDTSGGADVGAIIQQAMNSHSQIIIPGSGSFGSPFRYNVKTTVNVPDNVIIECEPGAEFLDEVPCTGNMTLFVWSGTASVAGAGMYGCMFKGSASELGVPTSYAHTFIRLNTANNYTIEGNYTTNSCGDSDIRLDGCECSSTDHGSTGNLIAFNDTENAENGIAVINGWSNIIKCNTAFNGGLVDEEPNQSYAQCGDNLYTRNYEVLTGNLPNNYGVGFSVGGNNTSCPPGSGVCAKDTVTDNVFNANGFSKMGVDCECNAAGTACDNAAFGGTWSGNVLVGGTRCSCGSSCSQ